MNLFGVMEVSGSALKAERIRAEVVAANMANAETTRTADGTPYQRQHVVFAAADGAKENFHGQLLSAGGIFSPGITGAPTPPGGVRGYRSGADRARGGAPLRSPASGRR